MMTVSKLLITISWPKGQINKYQQTVVQKRLRHEPGVLGVLFPGINDSNLRIDYDPDIISNFEIIQILHYFKLDFWHSETC